MSKRIFQSAFGLTLASLFAIPDPQVSAQALVQELEADQADSDVAVLDYSAVDAPVLESAWEGTQDSESTPVLEEVVPDTAEVASVEESSTPEEVPVLEESIEAPSDTSVDHPAPSNDTVEAETSDTVSGQRVEVNVSDVSVESEAHRSLAPPMLDRDDLVKYFSELVGESEADVESKIASGEISIENLRVEETPVITDANANVWTPTEEWTPDLGDLSFPGTSYHFGWAPLKVTYEGHTYTALCIEPDIKNIGGYLPAEKVVSSKSYTFRNAGTTINVSGSTLKEIGARYYAGYKTYQPSSWYAAQAYAWKQLLPRLGTPTIEHPQHTDVSGAYNSFVRSTSGASPVDVWIAYDGSSQGVLFVRGPEEPEIPEWPDSTPSSLSLEIRKEDGSTGATLSGAEFVLENSLGVEVRRGTTDYSGKIFWDNLEEDSYVLREVKAPEGYQLLTSGIDVAVTSATSGRTKVVKNFKERPKKAELNIRKVDGFTWNTLAGAEFTLENSSGVIVKRGTTNSMGEIFWDDLEEDLYTLREVKAPEGYQLLTSGIEVSVTSATSGQTTVVENTPIDDSQGKITVYKKDAQTGEMLRGAVFDLINDATGESMGEEITKWSGRAVWTNLKAGSYTIKEVTPPSGYELATISSQNIVLTSGTDSAEVTFENEKSRGSLTIYKEDAQTNDALGGAEFELFKDGVSLGTKTTSYDGSVRWNDLEPGDYEVREIKAPKGYNLSVISNKTVTVTTGHTSETFLNEKEKGQLLVTKRDALTREVLAGAKFELSRNGSVIDTKTTDASGAVSFTGLEPGEYVVREVSAPKGYRLSVVPRKTVTITSGSSNETFLNDKEEGQIIVTKKDVDTGDVLAGAVFELSHNGSVVDTQTTDDSGVVSFTGLTPGEYEVREITAPKGYKLAVVANQTATLKDHGTARLTFENELYEGAIQINKVDAKDKSSLAGAVFELVQDGVVLTKGTTDTKGRITFSDLKPGDYVIRETQAPQFYRLSVTPERTVVVKPQETAKVTVENEKVPTELRIHKVDQNDQPLEGVEFTVYTVKNGKRSEYGKYTTDKNGHISVTGLPMAEYEVKESKGLTGYELSSEVKKVSFTDAGSDTILREVSFVNTQVPTLQTELTWSVTKDHTAYALPKATFQDKVSYTGLAIGQSYTLEGQLVNAKDKNQVVAKAQKTFTPKAANGSIVMDFTFDASKLAGQSVVALQHLFKEGGVVAAHADLNNASQTVRFANPQIQTVATIDGDKVTDHQDTVSVSDEVRYSDVIPGLEITTSGQLVTSKGTETGVTQSHTFTPTKSSGTFHMDYDGVDLSQYQGQTLVVLSDVHYGKTLLTSHADLDNKDQSVDVTRPKVETEATNKEDGSKVADALEKVTIQDKVSYEGLIPGKEYRLEGTLMVKNTKKPLTVDGKVVKASKTFTPKAAKGTTTLDFTFNAKALQGKSVVVFERVYREDIEVATHTDITDKNQTVDFPNPEIGTTATNKEDGSHTVSPLEKVTIQDKVAYKGLIPGKEYTVKGRLMVQSTGKALVDEGQEVTASKTFTAETADGFVTLDFTFNANRLRGESVVVFEQLYRKGTKLAVHEDLTDKDQTVDIPDVEIQTEATNTEDGSHVSDALAEVTIQDKVSYTNLVVGKEYTVKGHLMRKSTNTPLEINGKRVEASKTFVADKANGFVTLDFTFDAHALQGESVVAFERLEHLGEDIAFHEDITDESQTVHFPEPGIGTTATNKEDGEKVLDPLEMVTIQDEVSYTDLIPGKEYTVKGQLMNQATGEGLLVNGHTVTQELTFTPDVADGSVFLDFTVPGDVVRGKTLVVFEKLFRENVELTAHEDLEDAGQTVRITEPEVETEATNKEDGTHVSDALAEVTIQDEVFYRDLIPGKEYTVSGTLMVKETNQPLLVNGNPVTNELTFVAPAPNGSVFLDFTFDARALQGQTVVAFEKLHRENIELAVHEDITDEDQSVEFPEPHIGTTATNKEDGEKVLDPLETLTIQDEVRYTNLIPGKEYTVSGRLMDKETGNVLVVNDQEVTSELTFKPETSEGSVFLDFVIPGDLVRGQTFVVFEKLFREGVELTAHEDLTDEGQTVRITEPGVETEATNKEDDTHVSDALANVTIQDEVFYRDLIPGKEYTVNGVLMVKETNQPLLDNGSEVRSSLTFVAPAPSGSVMLDFTFNARALQGRTVVAFEELHREGITLATHEDITDEDQSIHFPQPEIGTTATNKEDGEKVLDPLESLTIRDEVTYTNLIAGKEYTVKGRLMDKETGNVLVVNGQEVTSELTFVAPEANGSVFLDFVIPGEAVRGKTLVVFEKLFREGVELTAHEDLEDQSQTVRITESQIRTTATNKEDGQDVLDALNKVTVQDEVVYEDLIPGKEYTVNGVLMVKETNQPLLDNGKEVRSSLTFVAPAPSGSVILDFTFNASALQGQSVVAFEKLLREGVELAVHEDITDEEQTVHFPEVSIGTKARNPEDDSQVFDPLEEITIRDEVIYTNLIVGKEYTVSGRLMDKETGKALVVNGREVTQKLTFVAPKRNGSVFLDFTIPGEAVRGKILVAFERLSRLGTDLAVHEDLRDSEQTVRITEPGVETEATNKEDGTHVSDALSEVTIQDEVFYTDLIPGKEYTINGHLMVKETNEALVVNGERVTASKTFVAPAPDGSILLDFTFDASALQGHTVVAFESLQREGFELAHHKDIHDRKQSVDFPKVDLHTTATEKGTGLKHLDPLESITVQDDVAYTGLIVGKEYTISGRLMDKATGQVVKVNGRDVTAERTFVAETSEGSITLDFTMPGEAVRGQTLVVFERLSRKGTDLGVHEDLEDKEQTVWVEHPEIGTTAHTLDGLKQALPLDEIVIQDDVHYSGLVPGKEYTLTGWVMDQDNGSPVLKNGGRLETVKTFVAEGRDGVVTLDFVLQSKEYAGHTLVVFETLTAQGTTLATHHDLYDKGQSVEITQPSMGTFASVGGSKEVLATGQVVITDIVEYEGLVPGYTYDISGWLMRQSTNEPFLVNGERITSHLSFVPESASGRVSLDFVIPDASLVGNDTLVVFEELSYDGQVIAEHKDINDEAQSVHFTVPEVPEVPGDRPGLPQTGGLGILSTPDMIGFVASAGAYLASRRRRS